MWISFPCKISPGPHLLGHVTIASYICSDHAERHKDDLDDGDPTYLDRACRGRALQTRRHQAAASRPHSGDEVVEGRRQATGSLYFAHEARLVYKNSQGQPDEQNKLEANQNVAKGGQNYMKQVL